MTRLLAILRSVPPRELAEDLIGAALLDPALLEPFERELAALPPVEAQVMIRDFRFVVS